MELTAWKQSQRLIETRGKTGGQPLVAAEDGDQGGTGLSQTSVEQPGGLVWG